MTPDLPTIEQCLEFHDRYEMFDNIRAHSFVVARVAGSLVEGMERNGTSGDLLPNRQEVIVGGLLHDIAKTLCLKTGCRHAEVGQQICEELGYRGVAAIVAEHVILKNFNRERYAKGIFNSKEIVFYADKRVLHDQLVSLEGRLAYILERYGDSNPRKEKLIRKNFAQAVDFEKFLFQNVDFAPTDLAHHLSPELIIPVTH